MCGHGPVCIHIMKFILQGLKVFQSPGEEVKHFGTLLSNV